MLRFSPSAATEEALRNLGFNETLSVPGQGALEPIQGNVSWPSGGLLRSAQLVIQTPSSSGAGPLNVTISGTSGPAIWDWPYALGAASISAPHGSIETDNGTATAILTLPRSNLTAGGAFLQNTAGAMVPGYRISVEVGGISAFSRSGNPPFLPFVPLNWSTTPDQQPITAFATGPDSGSTTLVGVGDGGGGVSVYDLTPGSNASVLLHTDFYPAAPVSAIAYTKLFPGALPWMIASSRYNVFLIGRNPSVMWGDLVTTLNQPNGDQANALALGGGYVGSTPTALMTTSGSDLQEITWNSVSGWSGAARLTLLPFTSPSMSTAQASSGDLEIALGGSGGAIVYNLTASGLSDPVNLTLPEGVGASNVELAPGGQQLLILGANGALYGSSAPGWQVQSLNVAGTWSQAYLENNSGPEEALLMATNGSVWELPSPFSVGSSLRLVSGGSVLSNALGAIASVYGSNENDVIGTQGAQLAAAEYTPSFNSTHLGASWQTAVQSYVGQALPTPDAWGNEVVSAAVTLAVQGGSCRLSSASVAYNVTLVRNVTSWFQGVSAHSGGSSGTESVKMLASAGTAGVMHIELAAVVGYPVPAPPTPVSRQILLEFLQDGPLVILGLAVAGGACIAVGFLRYRKAARYRGPGRGVSRKPSPPRGRSSGVEGATGAPSPP